MWSVLSSLQCLSSQSDVASALSFEMSSRCRSPCLRKTMIDALPLPRGLDATARREDQYALLVCLAEGLPAFKSFSKSSVPSASA